ncbi:MAG: phage tail protein [Oscillospiraceae bacterium]|nr:phage tail protein [Oscillospiraceae bacterium]
MIRKYKIGYNRLFRGFKEGLEIAGEAGSVDGDKIVTTAGSGTCLMFLKSLDKGPIESGQPANGWGRLTFNAKVSEDSAYSVMVSASDNREFVYKGELVRIDDYLCEPAVSSHEKKQFLAEQGAGVFTNNNDILLYEQSGRYLWIFVEIHGGEAEFSDFCVYAPGDNFFKTFPEVFRKDGDFFRRYISIFSSLYNDLQEKIDNIGGLLDVSVAPPEILPIYAKWMGLELDGVFMETEQLRELVKSAFSLIKIKGTRRSIEMIVSAFVKESFYINNDSKNGDDYGFTVFINRKADEKLHALLTFLIEQFKPMRTRAKIVFMGDFGTLDSGCYSDINSVIVKRNSGRLDNHCSLDTKIIL